MAEKSKLALDLTGRFLDVRPAGEPPLRAEGRASLERQLALLERFLR